MMIVYEMSSLQSIDPAKPSMPAGNEPEMDNEVDSKEAALGVQSQLRLYHQQNTRRGHIESELPPLLFTMRAIKQR